MLPLRLVVLLAGTVTLALEVLAGRYLSPAFGSSLFVWAAVLAITLLCLAIGYRWGGGLGDRHPSPARRLVAHLLAAAGWIGALPLAGGALLKAALTAGPAMGPPLAVALLFGVPLTLLGTVVPLAFGACVRAQPSRPGRRLGDLFAISTVGSVAGALATGYLAVPLLGLQRSFFLLALVLLAAILPALWAGVSLRAAVVLLAALVAGSALPPALRGAPELAPGVRFLERRATRYGQLDVLADDRDGTRVLLLDGASQNWVGRGDWSESRFGYVETVRSHAGRWPRGERRALVLGLGAGTLVRGLLADGYRVEVVEIDPAVVDVAVRHFAFPVARVELALADARAYLERRVGSTPGLDLVVFDVTGGGHHPEHVHSLEAFRLARRLLGDDGVLVVNLVLHTEPPRDRLARHATATVARAFEHVEALDLYPDAARRGQLSELLVIASGRSPSRPPLLASPGARLLAIDRQLPALTDDWNPAPLWSLEANREWHENMRRWLGDAVAVPG